MALQTQYYEITINATPEKVHRVMLDKETYKKWTIAFSPTSDFRGDWSEDSKIYFISTDEDNEMGMIATIDKNIPGELVAIRHIGMLGQGQEIYEGEHVEEWKNAYEIYRFRTTDNGTHLICSVEIDSPEHQKLFAQMWPKALNLLKELCE